MNNKENDQLVELVVVPNLNLLKNSKIKNINKNLNLPSRAVSRKASIKISYSERRAHTLKVTDDEMDKIKTKGVKLIIEELEKEETAQQDLINQRRNSKRFSINGSLFKSGLEKREINNLEKNKMNFVKKHRNINQIFQVLLDLVPFTRYLKYNLINEESLREAIAYIKYQKFTKGENIFYDESEGHKFFILLKGRVNIKHKMHTIMLPSNLFKKKVTFASKDSFKNLNFNIDFNLNKDDDNNNHEEQKIIYKSGECFGDWEILNSKNIKSKNAIVEEEAHLIYLDKKKFLDLFSRSILKADIERRDFVKNIIKPFKTNNKFDNYYKKMKLLYFEKEEIIYSENSHSDCFYLILQGGCSINKLIPDAYKLVEILKIEKGSVFGLESIFEFDNKMKFNLKCTQNFTIILKIRYEDLNTKINSNIEDYLQNIYKTQIGILLKNFENYKIITKQNKLVYNKHVKIRLIKGTLEEEFENDLNDEDFLLKRFGGYSDHHNVFKYNKIKLNKKNLSCSSNIKNENNNFTNLNNERDNTPIKINRLPIANINNYNKTTGKLKLKLENEKNNKNSKVDNANTNNTEIHYDFYKNKNSDKLKKTNFANFIKSNSPILKIKNNPLNQIEINSDDIINFKKSINRSVTAWKRIKNNSSKFNKMYSTGKFKLPLLSLDYLNVNI